MPWATFGADVPRFVMPANRLLVEVQRTNGFVNPRCEGAAIGTPGTMPIQWSNAVPAGVTRTVVGTGVEFGLPYIELRFQTAGAVTVEPIEFQPGHVAASPGQVWTCSVFHRLVAGSMANASLAVRLYELGGTPAVTDVAFAPTAAIARAASTRTVSDPASFVVNGRLLLQTTGAADFTLRVYAPQMERGSFPTTPILPPPGTPGASTRGADIVTAPLAPLGVAGNGACTVLKTGLLERVSTDIWQTVMQIDDGGDNNRYLVRVDAGGAAALLYRVTAGVVGTSVSAGAITGGVPYRIGMSLDGAGRMAVSLNGAAPVAITGGPISGLTTLRDNCDASGFAFAQGETGTLRVIPSAVSDATLQSLVAGLSA